MFSKREYTREGFDLAQGEARDALNASRMAHEEGVEQEPELKALLERARTALHRFEQMYARGEAEARVLNREYDKLRDKAEAALKTLYEFERLRLGMHGSQDDRTPE